MKCRSVLAEFERIRQCVSAYIRWREAANWPRSVALLVIGGLPEEFFPVFDFGLHAPDTVEKSREIGDAVRLRGEFEAGIAEQGNQVVDAFRRFLRQPLNPNAPKPVAKSDAA